MKTTTSSSPPPLIPTGTARARFQAGGGSGAEVDVDRDVLGPDLWDALSAHDVVDSALLAAWEAARWAGAAAATERRALGCLVVALLQAVQAGGTFLPLGPNLPAALRPLGIPEAEHLAVGALARALLDGTAPPSIAALFGPPGARRPFVVSDGCLYTERLWHSEAHLVSGLRARLAATVPPLGGSVDDALAAVRASAGAPPLADEQVTAVRAALTQPLTVIAGGPGTGKTSVVVALLRTLARLQVPIDRIALAAPTGRAAQRIKEAVDVALARLVSPEPRDVELAGRFRGALTLHRLLGIRTARINALEPEGPEFYDRWPLPHQFVIVDEASMIDLVLMDQLVSAIGPGARLILLGDADQLPSVEVGAVFRELVAGDPPHARRLKHSHRMNPRQPAGAQILGVANAVNAGDAVGPEASPLLRQAAALRFTGFERLAASDLAAFLERWHREILDGETQLDDALGLLVGDTGVDAGDTALVDALLKTHEASRLLCLTRTAGRRASVAAVNAVLHGHVQTAALARGVHERFAGQPFLPGEPVIMLRNDYARRLSNGDIGVVVRRAGGAGGEALAVAFARGAAGEAAGSHALHALEDLAGDLALAFALTVHKAQGSEYDRVALILPETDVPLLSRELLYTALTRARQAVVVVGDPALFTLATGRTLDRTSAIARRLRGA